MWRRAARPSPHDHRRTTTAARRQGRERSATIRPASGEAGFLASDEFLPQDPSHRRQPFGWLPKTKPQSKKGLAMAQYLISFPSGAMDHIPEQEMPDVAKAAHAVVQEAIKAGVYVAAGGLVDQPASIVATDGTVTEGANPDLVSGFTIVDVSSREEALKWAARTAAACRCAQEVREVGFDPGLDEMLSYLPDR
jgi:hypothetical protein